MREERGLLGSRVTLASFPQISTIEGANLPTIGDA